MGRRVYTAFLIGMGGIMAIGGLSCHYFDGKSDAQKHARSSQSAERDNTGAISVKVVKAKPMGMERTTSRPGSVHAFAFAELFAKVSGYLKEQKVDIGDHVKENDLLAELYVPEVVADLDRANAGVRKSEADVDVKKARLKAATANLAEAKIQVEQTKADWKKAVAMLNLREEQYQRFQKLVQSKAVEAELLDEKKEARQAAKAKEFSAKEQIKTSEARVTSVEADRVQAKAEVEDARANVAVAKAALARAQAMVDYTKIKAPFTGVITQRFFHPGDFIRDASQGSGKNDPLFRLARNDLMRVIIFVPDKDAPFVNKGQAATLTVDALPGEKFTGKVARLSFAEDYTTRTMRTEIDLPNKDHRLRDGMFGTLSIDLGPYQGVTVPSVCLTNSIHDGNQAIFIVRGGRAHNVDVQVTADDGIQATIQSKELHADDEIVAEHGPGLTDGAAVKAEPSHRKSKKREK